MPSLVNRLIESIRGFIENRREAAKRSAAEREELERRRKAEEAEKKRQRDFLYSLGNRFEDHVARMFDPERFELIHRTPTDEETGGRYVRDMVYPDLAFREVSTGRRFWVECKFRAHAGEHWEIEWCTETQLRNYWRTRDRSGMPVLVMIGLGGTAEQPERVYCLNLERLRFTTIFYGTYRNNRVYETVTDLDSLLEIADREPEKRDRNARNGE